MQNRKRIFAFVAIVACAVSCGFSILAADEEPVAAESPSKEPSPETTAQPTPSSVSPDKQWEYVGGDAPKLVRAGTKEAVVQFSCRDLSAPVWAPDSKRFAISCAGGKGNETSVYQLRDGQWVAPEEALGNGDELMEQVGKLVEAQAKKKGMPKHTFLHMQWWTVEPKQWLDASTLVVYAYMGERVHRQDGGDVGLGFGSHVLDTLKFDDAGKWKIAKTHRLSAKEVEEEQ